MTQFKDRAKAHVRKIFRVRQKLLDENKSLARTTTLQVTLEKMERQLGFFPYNTDSKMALFIRNHMAELMFLTPGEQSGSHVQMMNELNALYDEAVKILNHHDHTATVC